MSRRTSQRGSEPDHTHRPSRSTITPCCRPPRSSSQANRGWPPLSVPQLRRPGPRRAGRRARPGPARRGRHDRGGLSSTARAPRSLRRAATASGSGSPDRTVASTAAPALDQRVDQRRRPVVEQVGVVHPDQQPAARPASPASSSPVRRASASSWWSGTPRPVVGTKRTNVPKGIDATARVAGTTCTVHGSPPSPVAASHSHVARTTADFPTPAGPDTHRTVARPGPVTFSTSSASSRSRPTIRCGAGPGDRQPDPRRTPPCPTARPTLRPYGHPPADRIGNALTYFRAGRGDQRRTNPVPIGSSR